MNRARVRVPPERLSEPVDVGWRGMPAERLPGEEGRRGCSLSRHDSRPPDRPPAGTEPERNHVG